jgi:hypothetical protein
MKITQKTVLTVGHALGKKATKIARTNIYGTRPTIDVNAGTRVPHTSASGIGLRSVWEGAGRKGGAPVPKRAKSA